MSVAFRMRQEKDGRWRAVADGHPVEVTGDDVRDCLRKIHREALAVLPAVSWEEGPPVVFVEVLPRLVGVAEAAEILGWDKRRGGAYIRGGAFPPAMAGLGGGRGWGRGGGGGFRGGFLG